MVYIIGSLKTSEASFSEAKTALNTFSGCLGTIYKQWNVGGSPTLRQTM